MDKRYIRKDGEIIWVDMSTAVVRDMENEPLYLVSHFMDVTERKQAEESLRQNQEKYRHLVEGSNSIILLADKDLNITFMNEYGLKFFGYSAREIIGKKALGTIIPRTSQ